jgi:hypothetical protein
MQQPAVVADHGIARQQTCGTVQPDGGGSRLPALLKRYAEIDRGFACRRQQGQGAAPGT